MPVWHQAMRQWVKDGRLVLLGITQEQHPDRCRLFAQWQQFDWPILWDPINVLESRAVPILVAIDEHGIVRQVGPELERLEAEFLNQSFADDAPPGERVGTEMDASRLRDEAETSHTADGWLRYGDAQALWGGEARAGDAVEAYQRAVTLEPRDGRAHFRLGVCLRRRWESSDRQPSDFQAAVDAWSRALELDPNQYIWRRRIQQYGPRLDKPYSFYDWVHQAQADIAARGELPLRLAVPPQAAEFAQPADQFADDTAAPTPPDPSGRITRDAQGLIDTQVTVVPARVAPGRAAQIHFELRPRGLAVHWNNEGEPLRVWIDAPDGWRLSHQLLMYPQIAAPESRETRSLDCEIQAPASAALGTQRIAAYALYNVCEEAGGQCLFLRQDLVLEVRVGGE